MTEDFNMLWGKERRLCKLKYNDNYYLILALDHSLTSGPIDGLNSIDEINQWTGCKNLFPIPSVVLNSGVIDKLDVIYKKNIIVQMMGLPDRLQGGFNKVKTTSIQRAISLGATAVSVQLNINSTDLNSAVRVISEIVDEASTYGLPVLFMLNHSDYKSAEEFAYAIRICAELGADLIKTRLPSSSEVINEIEPLTSKHPPVVIAGGCLSNKFGEELKKAKELGFKGVCIGRNLFQNKNPKNVLDLIDDVFGG